MADEPSDPRPLTPVALQLYGLRDDLQEDADATLAAVRNMGYRFVEWFPFEGHAQRPETAWRSKLDDLGLRVIAAHVPFHELDPSEDLGPLLDRYQALGTRSIICPWLDEAKRDYAAVGERLNLVSLQCRARGFRLGYHNHDFELSETGEPLDGLQQIPRVRYV